MILLLEIVWLPLILIALITWGSATWFLGKGLAWAWLGREKRQREKENAKIRPETLLLFLNILIINFPFLVTVLLF